MTLRTSVSSVSSDTRTNLLVQGLHAPPAVCEEEDELAGLELPSSSSPETSDAAGASLQGGELYSQPEGFCFCG